MKIFTEGIWQVKEKIRKSEADNEEYAQIIADQIETAASKASWAAKKAKRAAEIAEKMAFEENEHAAEKAAAKAKAKEITFDN